MQKKALWPWVLVSSLVSSACKTPGAEPVRDSDPPRAGRDAARRAPIAASHDAALRAPVNAVPFDAAALLGDGGASACKLLYGPAEQPFHGMAALGIADGKVTLVTNDSGRPRSYVVPVPPLGAIVAAPRPGPPDAPKDATTWPPCEVAGKMIYCAGPSGQVSRHGPSGERAIARALPRTRIAASSIGRERGVVAYLVDRTTSEGPTIQAWAALDDAEPVRLSEDGSGATQIVLVPVGERVVAIYLDSRSAMTPIHARELSVSADGKLVLGPDAVIAIGGPAERGVTLAAGSTRGQVFALVPLPEQVTIFGMASVRVPLPPTDDLPLVWSRYAGGLDPAPLAATRGEGAVRVARVVPSGSAASAPRVLEVGKLDPEGRFVSQGVISSAPVTGVAVAEDPARTLWVLHGDPSRTWLERRACP